MSSQKRPSTMNIPELEEYIVSLRSEIETAGEDGGCGPCRAKRLLNNIGSAEARIKRLRRANKLAEARRDA